MIAHFRRTGGNQFDKNTANKPRSDSVAEQPSPSWEAWIGHDSPELPWPWEMEEDARSVFEIYVAGDKVRRGKPIRLHVRKSSNGRQGPLLRSLFQHLKARLLSVVMLVVALNGLSAQDTAQTTPQWSDPKIPAPFAKVLQQRGRHEFVNQAFDRIAYYPWPGFAVEGGGSTTGLAQTLGNGERVAYVAVKDRKYREVADTLVDLAQKMGPRPSPAPPFKLIFATTIILIGILVAVAVASGDSGTNVALAAPAGGEAQGKPSAPQPNSQQAVQVSEVKTEKEETVCASENTDLSQLSIRVEKTELVPAMRIEPETTPPVLQRSAIPRVLDINRMIADLERVGEAGWITRSWKRDAIVVRVNVQTEVLEAYQRYFAKALEVLRSRWGLEQVKAEFAQLEAQQARAELENAQAKAAKQMLEWRRSGSTPTDREDYDI